jgi:hypothetical protein
MAPAVPMDHHEKMRMRTAASRAIQVYPGPVGQLISRELLMWEEFGFRLGGGSLVRQLVEDVLTRPKPKQVAA